MSTAPERVIALWLPDWPVTAFLRTRAREIDGDPIDPRRLIAVLHANRVVACSAAARAAGVRRDQRRRDAQSACPDLLVVAADPGRDERAFHDVLRLLEELSPGVEPLQPGLAILRARGPARFYRGEAAAARTLATALADAGYPGARAGVADGVFTAEQAARSLRSSDPEHIRVVPPGASAAFLAPLPVSTLGDPALALLLARLGVQTLGGFAALDPPLVAARLGEHGARLQRLAQGSDSRPVAPRVPPPEYARELAIEPPLELAEQVAFAARTTADAFCDALGAAGLVCTAMRVTIEDDRGGRSERIWQHPVSFDAASVVDRVRWQLQPAPGHEVPRGAVTLVRIEPEAVDDGSSHQPALIGQGSDERAHHAMTRMQATLGHLGVLVPAIGGGRWQAEREQQVPWGEAVTPSARRDQPWPGSLPTPLPTEIFRQRRPARVHGADGQAVAIGERGLLTAAPAVLDGRRVVSWAGPWPVIERSWDAARARRAHRFQLVDDGGGAWLVVREGDDWWIEGRYG